MDAPTAPGWGSSRAAVRPSRATLSKMKKILILLAGLAVILVAVASWLWNSETGQDWLMERLVSVGMKRPPPVSQYEGLQVFLCGTSSPLPAPGRAQACVAILAGESLYIVDAGAGSAQTITLGRLPVERLEAILLTHFHSDHIAAVPEINLNSWVAGRPEPLAVIGPAGVEEVVDGLNSAYRLDRTYRVAHHGAELLPPELGEMQASEIESGSVLERGDLTISSFTVNHDPVSPAFGYRFDYLGRSVVVSGDAIVTPSLVEAATGADLLLQDALSLPIIQTLEKVTAGTRMETILHDIQDYHAHTSDLAALVDESGVRQLAVYHLVPPPQNALFEKIFVRDLPPGTVLTRDAMIIELPAESTDIIVIEP